MYYACAMTKHLSGHAKKWFMITGISVLILGGGYGGYIWYQQNQAKQAPISEDAKKEAAGYNIAGNGDIAARYVELMKTDKTADAQSLFVEQVNRETDIQKKVDLYVQNVNLALSLQKTDAALDAAKKMVEVRESHDTYGQLALVYIARGEPEQQITTLEKAIATLDSAGNVADKDAIRAMYESQLDAAKQYRDVRSRYAS